MSQPKGIPRHMKDIYRHPSRISWAAEFVSSADEYTQYMSGRESLENGDPIGDPVFSEYTDQMSSRRHRQTLYYSHSTDPSIDGEEYSNEQPLHASWLETPGQAPRSTPQRAASAWLAGKSSDELPKQQITPRESIRPPEEDDYQYRTVPPFPHHFLKSTEKMKNNIQNDGSRKIRMEYDESPAFGMEPNENAQDRQQLGNDVSTKTGGIGHDCITYGGQDMDNSPGMPDASTGASWVVVDSDENNDIIYNRRKRNPCSVKTKNMVNERQPEEIGLVGDRDPMPSFSRRHTYSIDNEESQKLPSDGTTILQKRNNEEIADNKKRPDLALNRVFNKNVLPDQSTKLAKALQSQQKTITSPNQVQDIEDPIHAIKKITQLLADLGIQGQRLIQAVNQQIPDIKSSSVEEKFSPQSTLQNQHMSAQEKDVLSTNSTINDQKIDKQMTRDNGDMKENKLNQELNPCALLGFSQDNMMKLNEAFLYDSTQKIAPILDNLVRRVQQLELDNANLRSSLQDSVNRYKNNYLAENITVKPTAVDNIRVAEPKSADRLQCNIGNPKILPLNSFYGLDTMNSPQSNSVEVVDPKKLCTMANNKENLNKIIADCCDILQLSDPSELIFSIKRLDHVSRQRLPLLEKFMTAVCHNIFGSHAPLRECVPAVFPYLNMCQQWRDQARQYETLIKQLAPTLHRPFDYFPQHIPGSGSVLELLNSRDKDSSTRNSDWEQEAIAQRNAAIHILLRRIKAKNIEISEIPQQNMEPDKELSELFIRHYMMTFEIKRPEGLLPSIAALQQRVESLTSLFAAICTDLNLNPTTTTLAQLEKTIRSKLNPNQIFPALRAVKYQNPDGF